MTNLFTLFFKSRALLTLVMGCLLITITSVGRYFYLQDLDFSKFEEKKFWLEKTKNNPKYDFVILGDSRAYHGIDPLIIEKKWGKKVFNLGLKDISYTNEYLNSVFLKLKRGNEKKSVLLTISPLQLTDYRGAEHFESLRERAQDQFEVELLPFMQKLLLPVDLKQFFRKKRQTNKTIYHSSGHQEVYTNKIEYKQAFDLYKHVISANPIKQNYIDHILNFIKSMKEKNVDVWIVRLPIHPEIEKIEARSLFEALQVKNQLITGGGKWVEIAWPTEMQNFDGVHLDGHWAKVATELIMAYIETHQNE